MLAFPGMIVGSAEKAGMNVPPDPNNFDAAEFPHFDVFCKIQLCRPMLNFGEHWDNAEIIAEISDDEIKTVTLEQLLAKGISYAQ